MITTCTVCQARYQLEDDKVPRRVIRVRCPACSGVFSLDGTRIAQPPVAAALPSPARIEGLESGFPAPQPPIARAER
ncbi:MAG: zinc-ribbon domain-containing protein, partial [Krumholzibacteria bacterium]|nr:zinc-ribbon domain-containing protein [Candidatus Krumholzibacteria bacterium]